MGEIQSPCPDHPRKDPGFLFLSLLPIPVLAAPFLVLLFYLGMCSKLIEMTEHGGWLIVVECAPECEKSISVICLLEK